MSNEKLILLRKIAKAMATTLLVETEEILDEIQEVESNLHDRTVRRPVMEREEMLSYLRDLRVKLSKSLS